MVKFYGYGLVWSKGDNSVLCEFKEGELITDNQKVIKKLKSLGYKYEELQEVDAKDSNGGNSEGQGQPNINVPVEE